MCSSFHVGKTSVSSICFCNFLNESASGEHCVKGLIMYTPYASLAICGLRSEVQQFRLHSRFEPAVLQDAAAACDCSLKFLGGAGVKQGLT